MISCLLLSSYLVNRTLPFVFAELVQLQFRRTFCYADTRSVVSLPAFPALKPDILSFALLSHRTYSRRTASPARQNSLLQQCPAVPRKTKTVKSEHFRSRHSCSSTAFRTCLFQDLRYYSCADCPPALTNSKPKTFLHSNGGNNLHFHSYVVTRHTHLHALALPAH